MVAYAEYLSHGTDILDSILDVEFLRLRYSTLLWSYGQQKIETGATSDSEAPARSNRLHFIFDSSKLLKYISLTMLFILVFVVHTLW